jgi:hypothetical protein
VIPTPSRYWRHSADRHMPTSSAKNPQVSCRTSEKSSMLQHIPASLDITKARLPKWEVQGSCAIKSWPNFTFTLPCCIVIDFFSHNQPDALIIQIYSVIKLFMFRHLLCPSSGVFYCTFGTGKFHVGFLMTSSKQSQFHPDCAWRWAEKMPETCRVL